MAEVTPPTVYRYSSTTEDVLDALMLPAMDLQLGPSRTATTPAVVFPNCDEHARLACTLVNSATWDRVRDKAQLNVAPQAKRALRECSAWPLSRTSTRW